MATRFQYRGQDGATIFAGNVDALGQIVSKPAVEVDGSPHKIAVENISDRKLGVSPFTALLLKRLAVGSNDGKNYILTAADPNGTLSKPWGDAVDDTNVLTGGPTTTNLGGGLGVWGGTGSHGVVITAINANGETIASVETVFNVGDVTDSWRYAWKQIVGATDYFIYVTDTPGTYGAYSFAGSTGSGAVVTFDHDGSVSVGTPPDDNTTGGSGPYYGTDPLDGDFGTADITIATDPTGLAVGQQWFVYFREVIPASTDSTQNTRQMQLFPTEV